MQENKEKIGDRIRKLREEKGLTQIELADTAGIGRRTISDYERNISTPDAFNISLLSKVLNVTTDYLIGVSCIKSPQLASLAPTEFEYALYDELKDLSEDQKIVILTVAKSMKQQAQYKKIFEKRKKNSNDANAS